MTVVSTGETVYLHKEVLLTGSDVDYATPIPAKEGPAIILRFTAEGKEKIANMTAKSVGRRYAIIVDGKVITAPKIVEPIPENATIFGFSSMTEAKSIAEKINRRDLHDQKEP
jgi:preprotein translocase subunit SecD